MLVIARRTGEGIVVSDDVVIKILDVGKDRVRIGIEAPKDVRIVREELRETEKQNVTAAGSLPKDVMEQLLGGKNIK